MLSTTHSLIPHEGALKEVDWMPLKDGIKHKLFYRDARHVSISLHQGGQSVNRHNEQ